MLKVVISNNLSIKVSSILALPKGNSIFETLKKKFTYKNPDYVEARKWGRSTYNIDEFIYTYAVLGDEIKIARGGIRKVQEHFKSFNIELEWVDFTQVCEPVKLFRKSKFELREDQRQFIDALKAEFKKIPVPQGLCRAATSFGKCHGIDTPIIMYDGSVKMVQDIVVGDQVLGPDSKPRNVLSLGRGQDFMYRVNGNFREPFVVNSEHILSLKITGNGIFKGRNKKWNKGEVRNISVNDYLALSKSKKHILKLWGTGVEFNHQKLKVPAYFLGLWIGDGTTVRPEICNNDEPEIVKYLQGLASRGGFVLERRVVKDRCPIYHFKNNDHRMENNKRHAGGGKQVKNYLQEFLKDSCTVDGKKIIPQSYLINSRHNRLQLLAGLIDSDGHLVKSNNKTYELSCKRKELADQMSFLSRSLGFATRVYPKESSYLKNGVRVKTGLTYRIFISGNTELIPVKLTRKMAALKPMRTDPLLSGFKVEPLGWGDYYGFTLDGDHLYLLKDFTVTHNTFTCIYFMNEIGQPGLVLVHTTFLQKQWIEELTVNFGIDKKDIGGVGGVFSKPKIGKVNVALYHSMSKKELNILFRDKIGILIIDEGQKASVIQFQEAIKVFRARYRISVSANFERKDGKSFIITDTVGEMLYEAPETESNSKIYSNIFGTKSKWHPGQDAANKDYEDSDDDEKDSGYTGTITEQSRNYDRNILIAKSAVRKVKEGKIVIIFLERKEQAGALAKLLSKFRIHLLIGPVSPKELDKMDIPDKAKDFLRNNKPNDALDEVVRLAHMRKLDIIIATQKGEVGLSIETLDHAIVTTPVGNNLERFNQLKGRVERKHKGSILEEFGEKETPTVEVMVDNWDSSFNSWAAIKEKYEEWIIKSPYLKKLEK